jgi:hypothetical protein
MGTESPDASENLDLVTLFRSNSATAQMEAQFIHGVLDAGGVPNVFMGDTVQPELPFLVRVPKDRLEEAERLIAEAQAAGPRGAEEAERASESAE